MNEKEVIKIIQDLISGVEEYGFDYTVEESVVINKNEYKAIQGLLDLYEKEKNKELIEGQVETLEKIIQPELFKKYISKDKIREILSSIEKGTMIFNYEGSVTGVRYETKSIELLKKLLEE